MVTSIDAGTVNGAANEFVNGNDTITTGIGRDMIFGGGGGDTINSFASSGGTAAADGNNIVFGDHGLVDYLAEEIAQASATNPVRPNDIDRVWSIATSLGGNDTIDTGDRNDIVLGGFGDDVIDTGGGYNIALGDSGRVTSAPFDTTDRALILFAVHDFTVCRVETTSDTDFSDGGNDAIAGDNAAICYRPDNIDPRFRVLSGTQIYYVPGVPNSPTSWTTKQFAGIDSFATATAQNDPRHHTQYRILLLDHVQNDGLVADDTLATTPSDRYGNDYIAGGAGEDEIFGELGNDVIQGDGTIGVAAGSTADQLARRAAQPGARRGRDLPASRRLHDLRRGSRRGPCGPGRLRLQRRPATRLESQRQLRGRRRRRRQHRGERRPGRDLRQPRPGRHPRRQLGPLRSDGPQPAA